MARPKAADIKEWDVSIHTTAPPEGSHRVMLTIVDDQGRAKTEMWEMNAQAFRHLPERYSWEQHFYPAILKLTR